MLTSAEKHVAENMSRVSRDDARSMMREREALEKLVVASTENFILFGPPGTGKSSICRRAAEARGWAAYPIQASDQMSGASFFQLAWVEADGSMSVRRGPGLTAFADGGVLIVEEINEASQDALGVLTMLMVRGHGATVRTMDNVLVSQHDNYRVLATMNGDPTELPARILDRASAVPILCPSAAMIRALPTDLARLTMRAYAAARELALDDGLPFTYRQMQSFAHLREITELDIAALVAFNGDRERAALFVKHLLPLAAAPDGSAQ
jgi:MoxR-like ATPase